ncbi:hypothetical protein EES44_30260 [Streptomyces sp. ADI96-15]|nr:response regulator receiver protein [Streptomyces sp. GBA 94-10 4N24]ESQ01880.1 response regulator receiver protein [Streptomyces sp. PVA_94-07]RPK54341.1 hypothetical protein EES44_30260 [Streptomyces sp. ADI96-15]ESQ01677.1 response regulator receiver protein [Streptomyces sp. GBA 94-10 4N24]ESQ07683.1 response regulator receiver protein [Streptomyces sp. PVA_94-07]
MPCLLTEAVELLATLAPGLADAVRAASAKAYLVPDGTLRPIDRIAADRPFSPGKHRKHGMGVQILRSHAKTRALVEQAVAILAPWRLLRELRCSTTRITRLVQAVLTLHPTSSE